MQRGSERTSRQLDRYVYLALISANLVTFNKSIHLDEKYNLTEEKILNTLIDLRNLKCLMICLHSVYVLRSIMLLRTF